MGRYPAAGDTLDVFFSSNMSNFNINSSFLEIRAKASAIFERATRLSGGFDQNLSKLKNNIQSLLLTVE